MDRFVSGPWSMRRPAGRGRHGRGAGGSAPVAVPVTICGFAAAGFGVASVAPAAFHGADTVPGLRPGSGLTAVTWLKCGSGFCRPARWSAPLPTPPAWVGVAIVPLAGLLIAVSAEVLPRHVPERRPAELY